MGTSKLVTDIRNVLDALLRSEPNQAYDLLTVMLGDAQYQRDFEDWMGDNTANLFTNPKRSDYPKPEPRPEKN